MWDFNAFYNKYIAPYLVTFAVGAGTYGLLNDYLFGRVPLLMTLSPNVQQSLLVGFYGAAAVPLGMFFKGEFGY